MLPILGSLDVASLVPATYRASTSLVLQTVLLAAGLYIFGKLVTFIRWHRRTDKLFGNVPGPKERHWLFGSFRNMPEDGHDRMQVFVDWGNQYARAQGYLRLWGSFWRPVIVACHPTSMKKILKTAEPKPLGLTSGYRTLKAWLGDGLLISGGEKWARNRRLLTPAFHFDILKPYIHVYNDAAGIFVDKLNDFAARGEQFELFQHVCQSSLDIILRCAFSYNIDVQRAGETHPYVVAVNDLATCTAKRTRKPWLASDIIFYNTALGKKYKRDCDYVHGVAEDIINTRKAALEKIGGVDKKKYLDFLDILLTAKDENGVGLSYMDIRNEVDTFLFEGHDTTASAISWILYSLAEHPEYQQKCQEEVDEVLQGRQDVEWSDLPKLEYLTQCIKEGMRLHAPVAIVGRETTKPFPIADIVCPPGTNVMINIWMLHHNVEVWGEDHMDFRPDRFTKEACAKMDPYQYVPFSGGPRNCIGQNFAMNEQKVVIAKLLNNFTFNLVPGHVVRRRLAAVMRAENGIMMTVERRKH
ncbi:leukotriene-B4 omega-hydroxylase 3-like [Mya arenaria]|uniref:leukotriene-B4 omega-hydroxylase 3-like n=1 Tax=Mya arenaria TaxID=6604 RepID=UPI0022E0E812|nr:leukotriene-B4 omega-hydroxylase 3-like [Mya arenaria]